MIWEKILCGVKQAVRNIASYVAFDQPDQLIYSIEKFDKFSTEIYKL